MAVRFFRVTIEAESSQQTKMENLRTWMEGQVIGSELFGFSNDGVPGLHQNIIEFDGNDNLILNMDMYILDTANLTKYKTAIQNEFTSLNKTGIISARIIENTNCTHDEPNPQPDVVTEVMVWP